MTRLEALLVVAVIVAGIGGFAAGYLLHPATTNLTRAAQTVTLSGYNFSCGPSPQQPYLQGVLQFNLTSTYGMGAIVSVAYTGSWTGDTNQVVNPNSTKHVTITWGPGMMQNILVTQCPSVGVVIWLVQLMPCPNPPCDWGPTPPPTGKPTVSLTLSNKLTNGADINVAGIAPTAAPSNFKVNLENVSSTTFGTAVAAPTSTSTPVTVTIGSQTFYITWQNPGGSGSVSPEDHYVVTSSSIKLGSGVTYSFLLIWSDGSTLASLQWQA